MVKNEEISKKVKAYEEAEEVLMKIFEESKSLQIEAVKSTLNGLTKDKLKNVIELFMLASFVHRAPSIDKKCQKILNQSEDEQKKLEDLGLSLPYLLLEKDYINLFEKEGFKNKLVAVGTKVSNIGNNSIGYLFNHFIKNELCDLKAVVDSLKIFNVSSLLENKNEEYSYYLENNKLSIFELLSDKCLWGKDIAHQFKKSLLIKNDYINSNIYDDLHCSNKYIGNSLVYNNNLAKFLEIGMSNPEDVNAKKILYQVLHQYKDWFKREDNPYKESIPFVLLIESAFIKAEKLVCNNIWNNIAFKESVGLLKEDEIDVEVEKSFTKVFEYKNELLSYCIQNNVFSEISIDEAVLKVTQEQYYGKEVFNIKINPTMLYFVNVINSSGLEIFNNDSVTKFKEKWDLKISDLEYTYLNNSDENFKDFIKDFIYFINNELFENKVKFQRVYNNNNIMIEKESLDVVSTDYIEKEFEGILKCNYEMFKRGHNDVSSMSEPINYKELNMALVSEFLMKIDLKNNKENKKVNKQITKKF